MVSHDIITEYFPEGCENDSDSFLHETVRRSEADGWELVGTIYRQKAIGAHGKYPDMCEKLTLIFKKEK